MKLKRLLIGVAVYFLAIGAFKLLVPSGDLGLVHVDWGIDEAYAGR